MVNKEFNNEDFEFLWNLPHKDLSENQVEKSWRKFQRINTLKSKKSSDKNYLKAALAAAMLLLLFSSYFYLEIYNPTIRIKNYGYTDKEINLPDGSMVLLKEGGEISFKEHFEKIRKIELKGEAFFDVVKDSLKEFNVISGSTITKVLGTKFSIIKKGEKDVEISLYTGRLLVSIKDHAEAWGLIPGEILLYRRGKTVIRKFNTSLSFDQGNKFIDVNNIKLKDLFSFLNKRFDYEFDSFPYAGNKRVTLRINKNDSLDEILNILSIINNMTYEIKEKSKNLQKIKKGFHRQIENPSLLN